MSKVIIGSVGFGGANRPEDVRLVQRLLNRAEAYPRLVVDGRIGPNTLRAIRSFQARFMEAPDGRVDPGGRTLRRLNDASSRAQPRATPEKPSLVSQSDEWSGDPVRWPESKKLASLDPEFRPRVVEILRRLRLAGFRPRIFFAWRSVELQAELVRKGRSKVRFSFHNAQSPDGTPRAYAVDIVDRRWGWGPAAESHGFWATLGEAARDVGGFWGGDWTGFRDVAHVQHFDNHELRRVRRESGLG